MKRQTVAKKPPMGWNSFDCFGWSVTEKELLANVEYLDRHLKAYGWEYIVVDFCWSCPGSDSRPSPNQTEGFSPLLAMDEYGRLIPDESRFPSSAGGKGFAPLAEYVHEKGLKFGIHIMRGIPKQAVAQNTPVKGTRVGAKEIAKTDNGCEWLNHMNGLDLSVPEAQNYLDSLFELYESWGIDFIKVDDLSFPYYTDEIEGYNKAISACTREIVFSTSPGETLVTNGSHIQKNANMWRVSKDFWDDWTALKAQFRRLRDWSPYRTAGSWPDADMLPLGHISLRGPMNAPRFTCFTLDEQKTMMTLWAMAKSPLMLGGNLPDNRPQDLQLITNALILKINQESVGNRELYHDEHTAIWAAESKDGKEQYLALFNLADEARTVSFLLRQVYTPVPDVLYNIWEQCEEPVAQSMISKEIPAHGTVCYCIRR